MHCSKKFFVLFIILSLFSFEAFSIGAGVQFSGIPAADINQDGISVNNYQTKITGTFRLFRIPAALGLGLEVGSDFNQLVLGPSAFVDYYFTDIQIENNWNFYAGAGFDAKFMFSKDYDPFFSAGIRFIAGMDWVFFDNYLEYYVQTVASPSYVLYSSEDKGMFRFSIPIENGVRLHF